MTLEPCQVTSSSRANRACPGADFGASPSSDGCPIIMGSDVSAVIGVPELGALCEELG
jgi:hypothetical protein